MKRAVVIAAVGALGVVVACIESKPGTVSPGDTVIDDTHNADAQPPPPPPPPPGDGAAMYESGTDSYMAGPPPACASTCTCNQAAAYCFLGVSGYNATGGGTGDAALPACPVSDAGATATGCDPLPAACAQMPTCACVINALQPGITQQYHCVLDCTPDPGFIAVYCP
jgi:hypothetical protein